MPHNVILPKLGATMEEGVVGRWLKSVGESVRKGEALFEVQTDKVNMEVEAAADGVLARILCEAGRTAKVAEVIGIIAAPGEKLEAVPAPAGASPTPAAGRAVPFPAAVAAGASRLSEAEAGGRLFSSPAARRLAGELGVDLASSGLRGTGPDGRIVEKDVRRYHEEKGAGGPRAAPAAPNLVPLTPARRITAQRMAESARTVPHFYLTVDVRAQALASLREKLLASAPDGVRISYTDLIVRAVARALRKHPLLNASWADGQVRMNMDIHVGVAMAAKDGLRVPVIQRADTLAPAEVSRRRGELEARAGEGRLALGDLEGGTFTVSNLGMYGIDAFQAIITPPQAAVLAVGRIAERAVAENGQVAARPMLTLTLGVDHRVCDGADAARFLQELRGVLETGEGLV